MRRCAYCGRRTDGARACAFHLDVLALEHAREEGEPIGDRLEGARRLRERIVLASAMRAARTPRS